MYDHTKKENFENKLYVFRLKDILIKLGIASCQCYLFFTLKYVKIRKYIVIYFIYVYFRCYNYSDKVGDKMTVKKIKTRPKKFTLRFLVFGVFSIVVISAVLGSISKVWINIYEKYREKEILESKLVSLQEDGETLSIDVEKLQDPEYIARYLKEKYFYSSDNEYIIRLPQTNSGK